MSRQVADRLHEKRPACKNAPAPINATVPAELMLEGDLARIRTLAARKKTPVHPEDERVLTALAAGARNHLSLLFDALLVQQTTAL